MLRFEAKRGIYSPEEIIEEQLIPFLISHGFEKDNILHGTRKSHLDDEELGRMPIDLLVEERDPRSGAAIPRLLVVVKSPGRELRGFLKQAAAMGILERSPFVMVTDGMTGILLKTPVRPTGKDDIPVQEVEELPPIGKMRSISIGEKPPENLAIAARRILKIVKNSDELIKILEECDDIIKRKVVDTRKRFFLLSKFLFAKQMDEKAVLKKGVLPRFTVKAFDEHEKKGIPLIEKMLREFAEEYGQDLFHSLRVNLDTATQRKVVEKLEGEEFMGSDNDIKGQSYEHFLKSTMRQKDGQYFTPRKVINFILEMLQPEMGDRVLDPAAGSGGFLIAYFNYQRTRVERQFYSDEIDEKERDRLLWRLSNELIHGIELDDDLARLCKMNMIVHGDGHSMIFQGDGLSDKVHENRTVIGENMFDIIITNPPFGEPKIKKSDDRLRRFDLGKTMKWKGDSFTHVMSKGSPKIRNQQEPQHLFVERVIRCLRPGGKAAIVLPDGIFNNSSDEYARRYIMKRCNILAVVSMPDLTFTKSGTGVRTNVLFIEKKPDESLKQESEIFMAICDNIGYNTKGEEIAENDLGLILFEYDIRREENA